MGILDNLEMFIEKTEKTEKCHYCQSKAKYSDIAEVNKQKYDVVGVCECHSFKGLSSQNKIHISGSYNGRRVVSETNNEGPIPSPEAIKDLYKVVD